MNINKKLIIFLASVLAVAYGVDEVTSTQCNGVNDKNCNRAAEKHNNVLDRIKRQVINGTNFSTCVANGGYCQNHFDCCSGLCLSYSYKCVPRSPSQPHQPVYTLVQGGQSVDLTNRFGSDIVKTPVANCVANGGYCQMSGQCCSLRCLSFSYKCVPSNSIAVPNIIDTTRPAVQQAPLPIQPVPERPSVQNVVLPLPLPQEVPQGQNQPVSVLTLDELVNRFGSSDDNTTNANVTSTTLKTCITDGKECSLSTECCSQHCYQATASTRTCYAQSFTDGEYVVLPDRCLPIGAKCYTHAECCTERCHGFLHQCVT